jgi:hypothetical protein
VRLRFIVSLLFAGLLMALGLSMAQAAPRYEIIPEDAYWQKIAETQNVLVVLETAQPEDVSSRLAGIADDWATLSGVKLASGEVVPLDTRFFVSQLRASPPDLQQLSDQLTAMQVQYQQWPLTAHSASDLNSLETILRRSEFQWVEAQPSLWDQFLKWVQDGLWRLLSWLLPDQVLLPGGELIGNIITFIGSVVCVLVIALVVRELMNSFVSETNALTANDQEDEVITADVAFARAQTLSNSGDHRSAVRYLYLSALLLLDERGLLRYDRTLTNREYLQTVAHLPEVAATLREVVDVFDNVWYGYHTLDAAAFEQYAARVGRLRQQR